MLSLAPIELNQSAAAGPAQGSSPMLTLWRLTHGERLRLVWASICFVIKSSPVWAMPIVTGNVLDAVTRPSAQTGHTLLINAIVLIVLLGQNIPMHTLYAVNLSYVIRKVQTSLRLAMVTRLQQMSMGYHDEIESGRLQSKVLRDVDAIETVYRQFFNSVLYSVILVSVALIVTLIHRPVVALFYLLAIPLAVGLIRLFAGRIQQKNTAYRQEVEAMSATVSEMIQMIPITRAHAAEEKEVDRVHQRLNLIFARGTQLDLINELFGSSGWVCFNAFQFVCLFFSAILAWKGFMTVGEVIIYQGFFALIVGSINVLLMVYPQLSAGLESIRSITEVLECPHIERNEGKKSLAYIDGRITFENVSFQYAAGKKPAVESFNLDIRPGECVAFVGESGSGKSTLMSLVQGFRLPTFGRVLLDGHDLAELNLRDYRRFLAVVPQQTLLFGGTIRENITYGLDAVNEELLQQAIDTANAHEFIDALPQKLETKIGEFGKKLSGGQRQRIAIARAMLRNPRIILLDEATSALDAISEHAVQEAIGRLAKGRTTLIVAHRVSTIRMADRIVVMEGGHQIEAGDYNALLARNGVFSRLQSLPGWSYFSN